MTPEQLAAARKTATRPRRTVAIITNGTLRDRIDRLEAQLDESGPPPADGDRRLGSRAKARESSQIEEQIAALRREAADATLHVEIEGRPGTEWRALLAAHPPRMDGGVMNVADAAFGGANEDSIRVPMARACIIGHRPDPDADDILPLDDETVDWLLEWATDRQMDGLVTAALATSRWDDAVPLPRRRSTTQTSVGE